MLLLLYIAVALTHDTLAPLTTGPDELAHFEYVSFIADHGRLPQNNEERAQASYKSDQPPLYHWLASLPARLVDPAPPPVLKRVNDHPRRQLIERTRHAWGLYNTEDEQWPYHAEILRWRLGRWVAVLMGAATVAMTYFIARRVFADHWLALGAGATLAFVPRFALTGSMLNYETTLAFFSALFLWLLLWFSNSANQRKKSTALLLGGIAGLTITTKLSALIFPLEILVVFWLMARFYGLPWRRWISWLLWAAAGTVAGVSWWFGFVLYQFNTIAADGLWVGLLRPLIAADSSDATTNRLLSFLTGGQAGFTAAIENLDSGPPWEWLATFFRTFWTVGIEEQYPLGLPGLLIAGGLVLLAGYGLSKVAREQGGRGAEAQIANNNPNPLHSGDYSLQFTILLLHLGAALVLPLIRYAVTFSLADTAQGRHILFQTAPAFAILLVWGLVTTGTQFTTIVPAAQRRGIRNSQFIIHCVTFTPGLFLFIWTLTQLYTMTWAYLPPLPVATHPEAIAQAQIQLDYPFDDSVTLTGYTVQRTDNLQLRLDLLWQARAVSPVDYLTEVTLVDQHGNLQTQWLGHPAEGRYPTRAWDAGDIVRDTVWLPLTGLAGGDYQINVDLLPVQHQPVNLADALSSYAEPPLLLEPVSIPAQTPQTADFQIWQAGQPLTAPTLFRYRETIAVTLSDELAEADRQVQIIGPHKSYEPTRDLNRVILFSVGPDWPTGDYHLQITPAAAEPLHSEPLIRVIDRWQRQFEPPPVSRPLEANFAGQIKLLGYDIGTNRAEPGGGLPINLVWQGLTWPAGDYTIFTKLIKTDDLTVHGGRDRLPQEGYRTMYWAPDEFVTDPFGVPVDADAPAGIYYLNVGLYREVNGVPVSLPLVIEGQPVDDTSVNIGPFKIGGTPPGLTIQNPEPQVIINQTLGDQITLLGVDVPGSSTFNLEPETLNLKLYWRADRLPAADYTVFLHLRNAAGETVAQKDQPPLAGAYPTSLWDADEIIADEINLSVADVPPGEYTPVVGLYNFVDGVRLTVPGIPANEISLPPVRVENAE